MARMLWQADGEEDQADDEALPTPGARLDGFTRTAR